MKMFLLVSTMACAMLGAAESAAPASAPLMVTGAGATSISGHVVLHAQARGPAVGQIVPASGFLRAPNVLPLFGPFGLTGRRDLSGTVTCIGLLPGRSRTVTVSGDLALPVVAETGVSTNFTVLLTAPTPKLPGSMQVWINELRPFDPCGSSLFFAAGQELPEVVAVSRLLQGHFVIKGTS